jgi:anti-sigma factor RsiW
LDEKELEGGRFFMKHYTLDEWLNYVNDEISENTKQELEDHLYDCDLCLNHYLMAMEANESSLPILSDMSDFTDSVMAKVSKQKTIVPDTVRNLSTISIVPSVPDTNMNKKPFYQQVVFHYLLAAVATILLTFSGVFQSLAAYANSLERPQVQENKPSVTEGVINKTFAWMDSLEEKEAVKK